MVEAIRALQHQVVAALVGPVISLAIAYEEHPRMSRLHVVEQRYLDEGIVGIFAIQRSGGAVEFIDQLLTRSQLPFLRQIPSALHDEAAAFFVENVLKNIPCAVDRDFAMEL